MTIAFNYLGKLGQLGNQMFQYAATLGVARYTGVTFTIPNHDEIFIDGLGNRLRVELFDCFDIKPDNVGMLRTNNVLPEKGYHFNRDILHTNGQSDYTLHGFFQTERYFQHCADEVRTQFTFRKEIVDDCKMILDGCFDNPIALHIRRGDYLTNSGNHTNLGLDYYEKALSKFDSDRQVVVFSDDADWCMEQELFQDDRFIVSTGNGPYHDLYLMSQCSDFIIANSSFSWWGAWLSANENKTICSPDPKIWFGPNNSHLDTSDLIPNDWVIIE